MYSNHDHLEGGNDGGPPSRGDWRSHAEDVASEAEEEDEADSASEADGDEEDEGDSASDDDEEGSDADSASEAEEDVKALANAKGELGLAETTVANARSAGMSEEAWQRRFGELLEFKSTHSHVDVPCYYKENAPLGCFVRNLRKYYRRNRNGANTWLTAERENQLEEIGFRWHVGMGGNNRWCGSAFDARGEKYQAALEKTWQRRYAELVEFKAKHGHADVPQIFKENVALGRFVKQCRLYRKKKQNGEGTWLTAEREAQLKEIGFRWHLGPWGRGGHVSDQRWEAKFRELAEFMKANGHCDVMQKCDRALYRWVYAQRRKHRKWREGALKLDAQEEAAMRERFERLKALGFRFRSSQRGRDKNKNFAEMFASLGSYKEVHGDTNVPNIRCLKKEQKDDTELKLLSRWVTKIRAQYRHCNARNQDKVNWGKVVLCKLSDEQVQCLEALGFQWSLAKDYPTWETRFEQLRRYQDEYGAGTCNDVRGELVEGKDGQNLQAFVRKQRYNFCKYMAGKAPPLFTSDRIARLESIGFDWRYEQPSEERKRLDDPPKETETREEAKGDSLEEGVSELAGEGTSTDIVNNSLNDDQKLRSQAQSQQETITEAGNNAPARAEIEGTMNEMKTLCSYREQEWWRRYDELVEFVRVHGHASVPQRYGPLGKWCCRTRTGYRAKLTEEKLAKLEEIGFQFQVRRGPRTGDKVVCPPRSFAPRTELPSEALAAAKKAAQAAGLPEHVKGQTTHFNQARWDGHYEQFIAFKKTYGHAGVPGPKTKFIGDKPELRGLSMWVKVQREEYQKRKKGIVSALSDERFARLASAGFKWVGITSVEGTFREIPRVWESFYQELLKFREAHGHCDVPDVHQNSITSELQPLSDWVHRQRISYNHMQKGLSFRGMMSEAQIAKLDAVQFSWVIGKAVRKTTHFSALKSFKEVNGHCNVPLIYEPDQPLANWAKEQRRIYRESEAKSINKQDQLDKLAELGFNFFAGSHEKEKEARHSVDKDNVDTDSLPPETAQHEGALSPEKRSRPLSGERFRGNRAARNVAAISYDPEAMVKTGMPCKGDGSQKYMQNRCAGYCRAHIEEGKVPVDSKGDDQATPVPKKRGRPPGSKNKKPRKTNGGGNGRVLGNGRSDVQNSEAVAPRVHAPGVHCQRLEELKVAARSLGINPDTEKGRRDPFTTWVPRLMKQKKAAIEKANARRKRIHNRKSKNEEALIRKKLRYLEVMRRLRQESSTQAGVEAQPTRESHSVVAVAPPKTQESGATSVAVPRQCGRDPRELHEVPTAAQSSTVEEGLYQLRKDQCIKSMRRLQASGGLTTPQDTRKFRVVAWPRPVQRKKVVVEEAKAKDAPTKGKAAIR